MIPRPRISLPAVRDIFLPDPGFTLCDVDLSGADAQVVAWEAGDTELKNAFRRGVKIHSFNAVSIDPKLGPYERFESERDNPGPFRTFYKECKVGVHATNYGVTPPSLAQSLGWKRKRVEDFQRTWFRLHPGILEWHRRTEQALQTTRTIYNAFGFRRVYFDRPDSCFTEAIAWGPQSTVGLVCARGDTEVSRYFRRERTGRVILQVHDSLVFQVRTRDLARNLANIYELLHAITIPYEDPLIIPWGLAISSRSWGHVEKVSWSKYIN